MSRAARPAQRAVRRAHYRSRAGNLCASGVCGWHDGQVNATVTERERYFFDTRGFLVVRDVLSASEVAKFNGHLDQLAPEQIADPDERDRVLSWLFSVHPDFASLIDHDAILPYLREFVDEKVRIDGAYALVKLPGEGVELLSWLQRVSGGSLRQ